MHKEPQAAGELTHLGGWLAGRRLAEAGPVERARERLLAVLESTTSTGAGVFEEPALTLCLSSSEDHRRARGGPGVS